MRSPLPPSQHTEAGGIRGGLAWYLRFKSVCAPLYCNVSCLLVASDGPLPVPHFRHAVLLFLVFPAIPCGGFTPPGVESSGPLALLHLFVSRPKGPFLLG